MHDQTSNSAARVSDAAPLASWAAVAAIGVGAFALVTTEFLPVGLLPQIARDIGVTDGQAGLMVTVPGICAALAAPLCIAMAGRADRRHVLWLMLALLVASNVLVASAGGFAALLAGRVLLGIGVGGFWTVAGSLGARLRGEGQGPRATSLIFSGVSLGTVAGVPAGALLGNLLGWRMAFAASAAIAALVVLALMVLLPRIPAQPGSGLRSVPAVLKLRMARIGLLATLLVFVGQFAAYTYITPFLAGSVQIGAATLSLFLLGYGVSGFVGNLFGGWAAGRDARMALAAAALVLAVAIALLAAAGSHAWIAGLAVLIWGFAFGMLPIVMQTFLFGTAPGHLEGIAALFVSIAQVAIGLGALGGGMVADRYGAQGALWLGAGFALATCVVVIGRGAPSAVQRPAPAE
jgi:predicted MFS family arabinose efflux permease